MHTAKERQSGKTDEVKCRALVVYATETANRAAAILAIRTAMNRHYVATHEGEIMEKVEKVCGSYWKEGKRDVIPECVQEEIKKLPEYKTIWQTFAVLLPVKSVGVMGDQRTYEYTCAIRSVNSIDAMTADWTHIPYETLATMSNRIINEVRGINRVVYDISSKPPATIEWE